MSTANFSYTWPLVGNAQITEYLGRLMNKNKAAGAFIFNGPDNLGKTTVARYFAQSLLCGQRAKGKGKLPCGICSSCRHFNLSGQEKKQDTIAADSDNIHGDFHIVKKAKDKKNISIEQIREFIKALSMSSFLGVYKIGVIKHADNLSLAAANALLKTLEEPRANVVIILITHDINSLPATIKSRGQILNFHPVSADIIYDYLIDKRRATRSAAKNFSRLCLGRPALAVKFLEDKDFLNNYENQIDLFLKFLNQDINERFIRIKDFISQADNNREAVAIVKRALEVWQGLVRDLILLKYEFSDLIQYHVKEEMLRVYKNRFSLAGLIAIYRALRQAEENLRANVSPQVVMENVALYI